MDVKLVLYLAIIVLLIVAFVFVNTYKELVANRTEEEGFCNLPEDCEGLPHILCAGGWVCEQNRCGWVCSTEEIVIQEGGLGAATVECLDDSHCAAGACPDNSTYKKYTCQANRCAEINYVADPCGFR